MKSKILRLLYFIPIFLIVIIFSSCDRREEQPNVQPQGEQFSDKEKQLKEKEEFLRLKEEQLNQWAERLKSGDTSKPDFVTNTARDTSGKMTPQHETDLTKDTAKVTEKKENPKFQQKEKELNKKFGDPKLSVGDYLEYIKRGISDPNNFDANMKKASNVWENRTADSFKKNYKSVKKFVITEEPSLVSQKGNTATVKAKIKQTVEGKDGKPEEKEVTVTYNLVADKNGNWKIKSNIIK